MTIQPASCPTHARWNYPFYSWPTANPHKLSMTWTLIKPQDANLRAYQAWLLGCGTKIDARLGNLHLEAKPL